MQSTLIHNQADQDQADQATNPITNQTIDPLGHQVTNQATDQASDPSMNTHCHTYTSPFTNWDRHASVRSFVNTDDEWSNYTGYWMPMTDDSILTHPLIPEAIKQPLSACLLIGSLDFTYDLEQQLISPVSSRLTCGTLLPNLPEAVKVDALKVQCDEAFHALQAQGLSQKVRQVSGVNPPTALSRFLQFVQEITHNSRSLSTELLLFCSVVVSETLITKSLRDDWRDSALPKEIRAFFHQHYKDEVQHSLYFTWLLHDVWSTWSVATQKIISELWPQFIDAYLDSDIDLARRSLQYFDVSPEVIEQVIHETYYRAESPYQMQRQLSIVHTIAAFQKAASCQN